MNTSFPIEINNITLRVKKLNFKNYSGAFEIRKNDIIQFILVHNESRTDNSAWSIDHDQLPTVNQEYVDAIVAAIDLHYHQ